MRGRGYVRAFAVAIAVAVTACAQAPQAVESPRLGASTEPNPAFVACPQIDDTPLPPECVPYDPQALMDTNELYRERRPLSPEAFAAFEAVRMDVTAEIEELQRDDSLSADAVAQVLIDAGFLTEGQDGVRAFQRETEIVFYGLGPVGGCVFGHVSDASFDIGIQGAIMDGGCHEAFAH